MKSSGYVLLICGSRRFNNFKVFSEGMNVITAKWGIPSEVVSGGAPGTDTLAMEWAMWSKIPMGTFPAEWEKFGRSAGPKRNTIMVKKANKVVAFVDDQSVGTWDTIKKTRKYKDKDLIIFKVEEVKTLQ
jgi:hypothetical protein